MRTIQIKYFTDKIDRLAYIGDKPDWIDLWAAEDTVLKAGEFKLIPLGVAVKLPRGYKVHTVPGSSTFKNFGIIRTNHRGVIDEAYHGDGDRWYSSAFATRDTTIKTNDHVRQFRIMEHRSALQFNKVEALVSQDRGRIGSTGIQ